MKSLDLQCEGPKKKKFIKIPLNSMLRKRVGFFGLVWVCFLLFCGFFWGVGVFCFVLFFIFRKPFSFKVFLLLRGYGYSLRVISGSMWSLLHALLTCIACSCEANSCCTALYHHEDTRGYPLSSCLQIPLDFLVILVPPSVFLPNMGGTTLPLRQMQCTRACR